MVHFCLPSVSRELRGSQVFEHGHRSMTARAAPDSSLTDHSCRRLFWHVREKTATEWKKFAASAIGEPAEITNARESLRQEVL